MSIAVNNQNVSETETQETMNKSTLKRGRGRPKGSKNRPKYDSVGNLVVKPTKSAKKVPAIVSYDELD